MNSQLKTNVIFNAKKRFLILLDYDGTLTDFKKDPNRSLLPTTTRKLLQKLRQKHPLILITGRNLKRLYQVSGLGSFPAVGTHGFESEHLPSGVRFASAALRKKYKKEAATIWKKVKKLHSLYPGIHIEQKPYSSTLHYRGANLSTGTAERLVKSFIALCRQSVTSGLWTFQKGKKMVEVMPKGFSKGKAVKKLIGYYRGYIPLYAGDDIADIPALKTVKNKGIAIAVGDRIPRKYFDLNFRSPSQFVSWLQKLDHNL